MTRVALLLLTALLACSCARGGTTPGRDVAASDGCQTLAKQIGGASPAPEPTGRTDSQTGLEPLSRSGDRTAHSPSDPLQAVRVLTGEGTTVVERASLLFVFSESGKATFAGCVASDGRVGAKTTTVADPDPASPLAIVLDRVLVGGSPYNADLSSPIALVTANGRPPRMFGKPVANALPPLVAASFDGPSRLKLARDSNAKCEPHCLGVGVFVFDIRSRSSSFAATPVLADTGASVPLAGLAIDLPAPSPHSLRVAVIVSGSGEQTNVDPMYAFTAQVMA